MLKRREQLKLTAALAALSALSVPALAQTLPQPLRFGVVPYLPARRLAVLFEPVRAMFERQLQVPVQFHLASDYHAHLEMLRRREYDLTADALIFSRIAQRQFGYLPLARTQAPLQPVLVTRRGTAAPHSAQTQPATPDLRALRSQTLAVSDGFATLTVIAMRYLRDNGLRPGTDVRVSVAGSHANAMQLVLLGQAQAAVVSLTALRQVDPATAAQLHIIYELPAALSAVVYLLAPRLAHLAPTLAPALLHFANQQTAGRAFIETLGHQGLLPVGPELAQVDPLVVEFYRLLAQGGL